MPSERAPDDAARLAQTRVCAECGEPLTRWNFVGAARAGRNVALCKDRRSCAIRRVPVLERRLAAAEADRDAARAALTAAADALDWAAAHVVAEYNSEVSPGVVYGTITDALDRLRAALRADGG